MQWDHQPENEVGRGPSVPHMSGRAKRSSMRESANERPCKGVEVWKREYCDRHLMRRKRIITVGWQCVQIEVRMDLLARACLTNYHQFRRYHPAKDDGMGMINHEV